MALTFIIFLVIYVMYVFFSHVFSCCTFYLWCNVDFMKFRASLNFVPLHLPLCSCMVNTAAVLLALDPDQLFGTPFLILCFWNFPVLWGCSCSLYWTCHGFSIRHPFSSPCFFRHIHYASAEYKLTYELCSYARWSNCKGDTYSSCCASGASCSGFSTCLGKHFNSWDCPFIQNIFEF